MRDAVIIAAVRTAIGKFQGSLASFSAVDLGAWVVREVVRRAGIEPAQVDEVILGNVVSAGLAQNPARQAGLKGGLHPSVAAMTINKVCGSGLKAVAFAVQAVAVIEQLGLEPARTNVNGGAVALGHPSGASGARILVTLLYEMAKRNATRVIAALCLGGGNAVALAVER